MLTWQKERRSHRGGTQVEKRSIFDFTGTGQIEAAGGISALRGKQFAFQFATRDAMLGFLLYVPYLKAEGELRQLLLFLHGDMTRDTVNCKMPGVADFSDEYGPADICNSHKYNHPVREFVVITPTSPQNFWWLRHPAEHDSKTYVPSIEEWFRSVIQWTKKDLKIVVPEKGVCLAGQSMGGYSALELGRAMPEQISCIAAGAPCFDAFRLDWLSQRLVNIPIWVMIGRNDAMCSFEESASLLLMMQQRGARLVRLLSAGLKEHKSACARFDKDYLYRWLLDPMAN